MNVIIRTHRRLRRVSRRMRHDPFHQMVNRILWFAAIEAVLVWLVSLV
jgi:hypothetical protein